MKYKADLITNCMNADLRSLAGLGYPPKPYNRNANECMNSTIKGDLKKSHTREIKNEGKRFRYFP